MVLFKIFINELENGIECTNRELADDTRLSGTANTLEDRIKIQNDLHIPEEWLEIK